MALKPEVSIPVGLATIGVVYGIFQVTLPPVADAEAVEPNNPTLSRNETKALWMSVAIVSAVSLIAKDATPFILGGATAVGLSWMHRHANILDPATGKLFRTGEVAHESSADNVVSMAAEDRSSHWPASG